MIYTLPSRKNLVLDCGESIVKIYTDPYSKGVEEGILSLAGELLVPRVLDRGRIWLRMEKVGEETLMDVLSRGGCPEPGRFLDLIDEFHEVTGLRWGDANPRNFVMGERTYMVDFEEARPGRPASDAASLLARVSLVNRECYPQYLREAVYRYGTTVGELVEGELKLISFFRKMKKYLGDASPWSPSPTGRY